MAAHEPSKMPVITVRGLIKKFSTWYIYSLEKQLLLMPNMPLIKVRRTSSLACALIQEYYADIGERFESI
jgi:hypothetical protein